MLSLRFRELSAVASDCIRTHRGEIGQPSKRCCGTISLMRKVPYDNDSPPTDSQATAVISPQS